MAKTSKMAKVAKAVKVAKKEVEATVVVAVWEVDAAKLNLPTKNIGLLESNVHNHYYYMRYLIQNLLLLKLLGQRQLKIVRNFT